MQPLFLHSPWALAIFVACYLVWMVPELIGGVRESLRKRSGTSERRFDGASGSVIMLGIWLLPPAVVFLAAKLPATAIGAARGVVFAIGILALLLGVALRWQAVRTLGRFFSRSVAIQPEHAVIEEGPYRLIRHPSYSGTMLTLAGIGTATGNWLAILLMLAGGLLTYAYRVTREERTLVREIGEPYRSYMARTKRFIPWIL